MTRTTLVLGAGASVPYGYPLGTNLIQKVIEEFEPVYHFFHNSSPIQQQRILRENLNSSSYQSIDQYLFENPDLNDEVRASIFKVLLGCETIDPTFVSKFNSDSGFYGWYSDYFNKLMRDEKAIVSLPVQEVITFNYDRSFEFYLYRFLRGKLGKLNGKITKSEDAEIFKLMHEKFKIHHVHGRLPNLPNEVYYPGDTLELPYQGSNYQTAYNHNSTGDQQFAKKYITTVYEKSATLEVKDEGFYRGIISGSGRVIFLGFAYLPENMQRIGLGSEDLKKAYPGVTFIGTNFRLGDRDCQKVKLKGIDLCDNKNIDCYNYFKEKVDVVI